MRRGLTAVLCGLFAAAVHADGDAGERAALARAERPPLGLPEVPVPADNPLTAAKIALGRKLFFDRRLSRNGTMSCGICHIPEQGFTSNELATAVGIEGRTVRRNAPSLVNAAYARTLFRDGREIGLERQALAPLVAANEMGNPSLAAVVERLRRLPDYAGLFERAFGRGPAVETLGQALAAWQRTLLSGGSPFDRWYFGGDEGALSPAAKRGFFLFAGSAGCATCHRLDRKSALFTDHDFHNTGVAYQSSVRQPRDAPLRVEIAPGLFTTLDAGAVAAVSEPPPGDLGRYEVTGILADRWAYKTPGLRDVALTAPYMHDGSLATLDDVVAFYNRGAAPHDPLDPRLPPLRLDAGERADLAAFLRGLTGSAAADLAADARRAPVGNP
jgi:cytochrome c peroxidase